MVAPSNDDWLGAGLYVAIENLEQALDGDWIGTCPNCGGTFALGYAGLLPPHPPESSTVETTKT